MIVKCQLAFNDDSVLIYDENKKYMCEGTATEDIKEMMGEDMKKFFYAEIIDKTLKLLEEAPFQKW